MNTELPANMPIKEKINWLKHLLNSTDYQAIKYAEGELTIEEYEPVKLQRKQWREEINTLEQGGVDNEK